jgi:hypothetical protein
LSVQKYQQIAIGWCERRRLRERDRTRKRLRILDRDRHVHVAEILATEPLDDAGVAVRVPDAIRQLLSLKPTVSTTSVSPSQCPTDSPAMTESSSRRVSFRP